MNAKAQAVADQIKVGSVLRSLRPHATGTVTVSEITEKSVYFTNGKYTNKRSLHWYAV